MADNSLVPVPEAERRRAAALRAKKERRQQMLAERGAKPEAVPAEQTATVPIEHAAFVLPPRVEPEPASSLYGRIVRFAFIVGVVLPTLLVGAFYAFMASEQFATDSAFAVRGNSTASSSTDLGSLFGVGGGVSTPESADSYILQKYIHSREMVERLIADANFLEIYSRPSIDFWYRLDPQDAIEDVVEYWQMMSAIEFDAETGIISLRVRAFRPQDAAVVTKVVIEHSEALVNELSLRAREDSVASAQRELDLAEERFAAARTALAQYRGTEQEVDPTATAVTKQEVVGGLEAQLAALEASLLSLRTTMSESSPRVVFVRTQIDALRSQIAAERQRVAESNEGDDRPVLTERLSRYEELLAEREFAEKSYLSRLATLEAAREEALKQQRYLAVFMRGSPPEDAGYPQAIRWTVLIFGGLLLGWGILTLVGAAIRDRMR